MAKVDTFEIEQVRATLEHIRCVQSLLTACEADLISRAIKHDASKFSPAEWPAFLTHTKTLSGLTYGSDDYKTALAEMRPALSNHYKQNPHHPEYHLGGIRDMTLLDLLEMLCDWIAATKRHKDGDIFKSIELNKKRFGYTFEFGVLFENSVREIERLFGEQASERMKV